MPAKATQRGAMAWLTRDGRVLASAEVAQTRADRRRGLLGRTEVDGVFILKARSVHTFGMKFPSTLLSVTQRELFCAWSRSLRSA